MTANAAEIDAVVTGTFGQRMRIRTAGGEDVTARIKGKRMRPVCGDRVRTRPIENESEWLITKILHRDNELSRPDSRGRREVLAANLQLMLVMAAVRPEPDWFIVDRYVAAAENMGVTAAIVFNKIDIPHAEPVLSHNLDEYRNCAYAVVCCSAQKGAGLDVLQALMADRVSIFVGQSGVGKSSVINRLVDTADLRTRDISASSGDGRHTTVNSIMLDLPGGGAVIDSPGVRDFAPAIESVDAAIRGYREINEAGQNCRFANCRHLREPDCAVKQAVDEGRISARRYESYRRLVNLINQFTERNY
jgi:ribosome biogenesis GTPase